MVGSGEVLSSEIVYFAFKINGVVTQQIETRTYTYIDVSFNVVYLVTIKIILTTCVLLGKHNKSIYAKRNH